MDPSSSPPPPEPDRPAHEPMPDAQPSPVPVARSEDLLQGGRELRILHHGTVYRLLLTRSGKLILQK